MLTEVKNNYKSILKHFDFDESISSAEYNKQKLAEMAKSGKPRPSQKTKLGGSLGRYTTKTSAEEYDGTENSPIANTLRNLLERLT